MSQIGTFTATKEGGWTGTVHTLTIETKVRLVPNDNRESDQAPAFRIYAGRSEIGAAWQQRSSGETPKDYLSVRLDDPSWPEPITAALFTVDESREARLIWSRRREDSR